MKKIIYLLLVCSAVSTQISAQTVGEIAKITKGKISPRQGQAGQTAIGQNVLLNPAGTGAFDLTGVINGDTIAYNWISLQVVVSGTVTNGILTFEGSNDGVTFYQIPLANLQTGYTTTSGGSATNSGNLTTTTNRSWGGVVPYRYFRARISTAVVGGGSIGVAYLLKYSEESFQQLVYYGSALSVSATGVSPNSSPVIGNPVMTGLRAKSGHITNDLADNDITYPTADINGKQIFRPYAIGSNTWNYATLTGGISNSSTALTMSPAQGAGIINLMTGMQVSIPTALGGSTELVVRDGASGTVLWRGAYSASTIGTWNYEFNTPIRGSANTLLEVACTGAVTGNIIISAQGFWEY